MAEHILIHLKAIQMMMTTEFSSHGQRQCNLGNAKNLQFAFWLAYTRNYCWLGKKKKKKRKCEYPRNVTWNILQWLPWNVSKPCFNPESLWMCVKLLTYTGTCSRSFVAPFQGQSFSPPSWNKDQAEGWDQWLEVWTQTLLVLNLAKSKTELTASVLRKDPKHTRD